MREVGELEGITIIIAVAMNCVIFYQDFRQFSSDIS